MIDISNGVMERIEEEDEEATAHDTSAERCSSPNDSATSEDVDTSYCLLPTSVPSERQTVAQKSAADSQAASPAAEALELMKNTVKDIKKMEGLPYAVYLMVQECFQRIPADRQMCVMGNIANILSEEMKTAKDNENAD